MTIREINKAEWLEDNRSELRKLPLKKVLGLLSHCFYKWKNAQRGEEHFKAESKRLNKEVERLTWILETQTESELKSRLVWLEKVFKAEKRRTKMETGLKLIYRQQAEQFKGEADEHYATALENLNSLRESIVNSNAFCKHIDWQKQRIQMLEQLLATQLVPVPGNPGMAFISHRN